MNKFYKILAFILIITFIVLQVPVIASATTGNKTIPVYHDEELKRAVSLGIGEYSDNSSITYKQFFHMLDKVVQLIDPTVAKEWKKQLTKARKSNKKMKRDEGMLALFYAAQALGPEYNSRNSEADVISAVGDKIWKDLSSDFSLFDGVYTKAQTDGDTHEDHVEAAYFFLMTRTSLFSNKLLLDLDYDNNIFHLKDRLSYQDALKAALRLYDSGLKTTERIETDADKTILQAADQRREEILKSKTEVTVKGTSYYISNSGNDNNDGLSPETAWATIDKVNSVELNSGDGIFLERGSLFRGVFRYRPEQSITYSAYGTGEKPKVYGSPENGADPNKWTLVSGTKNIWVFHKNLYDTGGIVFNEGKSWATRKTAIWTGKEYVDVINQTKKVDIKQLKNLEFYSLVDYSGYTREEANNELDRTGKIYLRCDSGNPGEIYDSIEFITIPYFNDESAFILAATDHSVIDNLCLRYCEAGLSITDGTTVQNCEVGWIGGAITSFNGASLGANLNGLIRAGDGIGSSGSDNKVIENYVHHIYDLGITAETGQWNDADERFTKDYIIKGNLIEKCSGGILLADWETKNTNDDHGVMFQNILAEDNYIMYTGYGWSHRTPDYDFGKAGVVNNGNSSILIGLNPKSTKNITFKDNVIYLSKYALVAGNILVQKKQNRFGIQFSGNTYVQNPYGMICIWQSPVNRKYILPYYVNPYASATIRNVLGDKTGKFIQ